LAVNGVSVLVLEFALLKTVFIGAGVLFLLFMGWMIWHETVAASDQEVKALSTKQQIGFAVTVSLLNPHAIIDTVGVIGTSSVNYNGLDKILFTSACIMISWIWFFCLAITGRMIGRRNQSTKILCGINKFSAVFMWATAIYLVYSSFQA
jgi:L-lysine exporter family protein LysE/ArgO